MQAWLAAQIDWHMLSLARDAVLTHGSTFGLTAYITSKAVQVPHLKILLELVFKSIVVK